MKAKLPFIFGARKSNGVDADVFHLGKTKELLLRCVLFFSICLGSFLFVKGANAATYYVDNSCTVHNGNGSCNGTDPNCQCAGSDNGDGPFNSIANMQAKAGGYAGDDNIFLKKGETFREQLTVPSSGTNGHPITFGAYGNGALPIIDGSNVVTGWSAATNSGSVTQANMKMSIVNGTAFVDFGSANTLTNYLGSKLTITDSAGKHLTGYIKAAGTGETYGSELLSNTDFANTSGLYSGDGTLTSVSGGQSGNALQVSYISGWADWAEGFTVSNGALLLNSIYMKAGAGGASQTFSIGQYSGSFSTYNQTSLVAPSSWTEYSLYATADMTTVAIGGVEEFWSGATALYDTASAKQVLTPSTTGVTITSTAGGSTFNWTSEDSGFKRDDSNYTYSISGGSFANIYSVPVSSQPNQVFLAGTLATQGTSISALTQHQWYYSNGSLYFYESAGNPGSVGDVIVASQRDYAINANEQNYIRVCD